MPKLKASASLFISTLLMLPAVLPGQVPAQTKVLVRNGTILEFTSLQPIDQTTAQIGDRIPLRLIKPLVVDGITLLPDGTLLNGTVMKVHQKDAKCTHSQGWVEWKPDRISFADASEAKASVVGFVIPSTNPQHPEILGVEDMKGVWVSTLKNLEGDGLPQRSHVGEKIGLGIAAVPLTVLFAPMLLADIGEYNRCDNVPAGVAPIPAGTTIVVVIARDHHVRI
jgi:hypothetical protein